MRPGSAFTAREIIDLLTELPDESAFIASIKASLPPDAVESDAVSDLRARRRFRGWTTDRELLAQTRDFIAAQVTRGKAEPFPRPYGTSTGSRGRVVLDLDQFPTF